MKIRDYTRRDKMVNFCIDTANNPANGYDQNNRWGPDYDCSSLMYTAAYFAGYNLNRNNPRYTGTMIRDFTAAGFNAVRFDGNLWDLEPGDILLNSGAHTGICIGYGQMVEASINEFGGISGGKTGDQAEEIHVTGLYNYPWDWVLQPPVDEIETPDGKQSHAGTLWKYHGDNNQRMAIIHNDDNTVTLIDCMYGLALDVNGNPGIGTPVNFVEYNGSDWQKWYVAAMPNTSNPDTVAPHVLLSKLDPNLVLDADLSNGQPGTRLQLWQNLSATNRNQSWFIEDTLNGNWIVRSVLWPDMVIDAGVAI